MATVSPPPEGKRGHQAVRPSSRTANAAPAISRGVRPQAMLPASPDLQVQSNRFVPFIDSDTIMTWAYWAPSSANGRHRTVQTRQEQGSVPSAQPVRSKSFRSEPTVPPARRTAHISNDVIPNESIEWEHIWHPPRIARVDQVEFEHWCVGSAGKDLQNACEVFEIL